MQKRTIFITHPDMDRLRGLLERTQLHRNHRDHKCLEMLEEELDRAQSVSPHEIPPDVVTMHSRARITDLDSGREMILTLVFPSEADIDVGKISVLAPIGTALLGYRAGDTVEWTVPAGRKRLRVEEVLYQPGR